MGKRNIFNQNLNLIAGLAFLLIAFGLNLQFPRAPLKISKQESATNVNQTALRVGSLGNKRLISSIYWISTLLESDTIHYKNRDLNSWMYLRFKTIATLDPKFYENYLWGGMYLSIVKDDLEGAAEIFERGLEFYPDDFKLIYQAGFHYYSEMGNFERGLELLKKVENSPQAPGPLKFIIKKLNYETTGDFETTLQFLLYSLENAKDDQVLKKKLSQDIYALKAQHDLDCLNSQDISKCDRIDAQGNPYVQRGETWEAIRPFKPYKIYRK
jgi:tetratricopeptide (TPR) repeat protein